VARPLREDVQGGFAQGLNTTADESQLRSQELRRADNARLTNAGAVSRILGSQRIHEDAIGSGAPVRGGFTWKRDSGVVQLLAVCGGKLYTAEYGTLPIEWTEEVGSLSSSAVPSFAAFRDATGECVYIADGGVLNKWNGTTLTTDIVNAQAVARVWVYNQRLHGVSGSTALVYYSTLNDGDSLGYVAGGGGSAVVRTFGGQKLTTGLAVGASSLMFHVGGISRFSGFTQDDIAIDAGAQGVSGSKGTRAPQSVVLVEKADEGIDAAFFLTNRGVFRATEGGCYPVRSDVLLATLASLDQSSWERVQGAHHARYGEVLFYLPDIGVYAYNYLLDAWSGPWTAGFTSAVTHAMWESEDAQGRPILLFGGADGFVRRADMPRVYLADVLSDGSGGSAYTMVARCRRFFFGDEAEEKQMKWLYVTANLRGSDRAGVRWSALYGSGQLTFADATDGVATVWGAFTWGAALWSGVSNKTKTFRVPMHARGPYVDITFVDDGASDSEWSRVKVEAFSNGRRG
jgi:hypothetical protein